jgi:5-methylcytosine-specific restriction endonuclease McrBC regulatory subunit McrC
MYEVWVLCDIKWKFAGRSENETTAIHAKDHYLAMGYETKIICK